MWDFTTQEKEEHDEFFYVISNPSSYQLMLSHTPTLSPALPSSWV